MQCTVDVSINQNSHNQLMHLLQNTYKADDTAITIKFILKGFL